MKTKIKNLGRGYWALITDEPSLIFRGEPRTLMTISSYFDNEHYCIKDYRYITSSYPSEPSTHIEFDDLAVIERTKDTELYFEHIFTFSIHEYTDKCTEFYWTRRNGQLIDGHDNPYDKQTDILKNESHIWSYKAAKNEMKKAKEYWLSFDHTNPANWSKTKIVNQHLRPTAREIQDKINWLKGN